MKITIKFVINILIVLVVCAAIGYALYYVLTHPPAHAIAPVLLPTSSEAQMSNHPCLSGTGCDGDSSEEFIAFPYGVEKFYTDDEQGDSYDESIREKKLLIEATDTYKTMIKEDFILVVPGFNKQEIIESIVNTILMHNIKRMTALENYKNQFICDNLESLNNFTELGRDYPFVMMLFLNISTQMYEVSTYRQMIQDDGDQYSQFRIVKIDCGENDICTHDNVNKVIVRFPIFSTAYDDTYFKKDDDNGDWTQYIQAEDRWKPFTNQENIEKKVYYGCTNNPSDPMGQKSAAQLRLSKNENCDDGFEDLNYLGNRVKQYEYHLNLEQYKEYFAATGMNENSILGGANCT